MMNLFQEKLIFRSDTLPSDFEFVFNTPHEELFLTTGDGAVLNGLHFKRPAPKGVILYCHGNKGQLDSWGLWAETLANRYNYDVVIWDYRGYGKSTGKRKAQAMLDDGLLFYDYCKKYFKDTEIIIFGRSLGGFFASHIAKQQNINKFILESAGTSLLDIAREQYPFLPVSQFLSYRFQSIDNVKVITHPTFIIHGTEDAVVPYRLGKELFENSTASQKQFYSIEGAYHNDLRNYDAYFQALEAIFNPSQ